MQCACISVCMCVYLYFDKSMDSDTVDFIFTYLISLIFIFKINILDFVLA